MVVLRVRGGELEPEPWIYAWIGPHGVVYVGATALHPATRTWLHLHDEDPNVGRLRARYPRALEEKLDVVAVPVQGGADRQQAKHAAIALLRERGLLAADHVCDPDPPAPSSADAERLVEAVVREWRNPE